MISMADCNHGSYVALNALAYSGKRMCITAGTIWWVCRYCGAHLTYDGRAVDAGVRDARRKG